MKKIIYNFSDIASKILFVGLPLILIYFIYLIIAFTSHQNTSAEVLIHMYTPQLEHIMASLTVLVIGALLFDITEKELKILKK